jgi:hypothetical protein
MGIFLAITAIECQACPVISHKTMMMGIGIPISQRSAERMVFPPFIPAQTMRNRDLGSEPSPTTPIAAPQRVPSRFLLETASCRDRTMQEQARAGH